MLRRAFGWWILGEAVVTGLTRPRIDVAASDRQVEQVLRESVLVGAGRSMIAAAGRAWTDSSVRTLLRSIELGLCPPQRLARASSRAATVRVVGLTTIVASVTALLLQAIAPESQGWLSWVVPAACAVAGVLVASAAEPIARAIEDKTR